MKYTAAFFALSILLLSQEINSFSARNSGLFQKTYNYYHEYPSTTSRHTERRRHEFPFATTSTATTKRPSTTTSLSLTVATPVATITGVITGGILGGALHAIAGPDHLAALLPRCCGQRWYNAGRIGILWGMGHGISVSILGVLGYALKSQFTKAPGAKVLLSGASHLMEVAVGFSLIVIGVMGLREAREWGEEMEALPTHSLSAAVSPTEGKSSGGNRAVIFNGLLHGFSWDGAPSLAPALAVASWGGNLAFLSAYAAGTVGVMAIATSFIGEGSRRAGEVFNRPDLPQKLSFFTSLLAIAIGGIWCGLAIKA